MIDFNEIFYCVVGKEGNLSQEFYDFSDKISFTPFFSFVDGRALQASEYFEMALYGYKRDLRLRSPSELGCLMSHLACMEAFLASEKNYIVVFEDDVVVSSDSFARFDRVLQYTFDPCFFCILGGQDGLPSDHNFQTDEVQPVIKGKSVWRTVCYLADRDAVQCYVKIQKDKYYRADDWLTLRFESKISIFFARVFSHPVELKMSLIENERAITKVSLRNILKRIVTAKFITFLRKIK